ncbi:MAG: L-threonylcarbamoyladenylate synthase [Planctomycetota bacterium]|jgi:protein-tyrosine phosphatase
MGTEVVRVDPKSGHESAVRNAAKVLSEGGLVAFPTETVYGVGACVSHPDAVARLRDVKSRPVDKAFTVHIGSRDQARQFAPELTGIAQRLIRKAWPGPMTLILDVEKPEEAPALAGLDRPACEAVYYRKTVGLRCPDDSVAETLLRGVQAPVVAASANRAGNAAPQTAQAVLNDLDGRIDLLIDAGKTRYTKPSTIVRVSGRSYDILREGVYDTRTIDRLSTLRLLFVCTGNTCRSPMAAALARQVLAGRLGCDIAELTAHGVVVSSAGTAGGLGGASENAVKAMDRRGLDISDHVSTALAVEHLQQNDYIYAMTCVHRDRIIAMLPSAEDRVALLLGDRDVRDPIGGSEVEYEQCAKLIGEGIGARLQEMML